MSIQIIPIKFKEDIQPGDDISALILGLAINAKLSSALALLFVVQKLVVDT